MPNSMLSSKAWALMDDAVMSAYGELNQILPHMEGTVQNEEIEGFCCALGILVTSFAFSDIILQNTKFYGDNDTSDPGTYRTKYLNEQAKPSKYDEIIHQVFVDFRKIQNAERKDAQDSMRPHFLQEFLVHTPSIRDSTSSDQNYRFDSEKYFRSRYRIHYCSVGEISAYTLVWKVLSVALTEYSGETLFSDTRLDLRKLSDGRDELRWLGKNFVKFSEEKNGLLSQFIVSQGYENIFGASFLESLELMGFGEENDWSWEPFEIFCRDCVGIEMPALEKKPADLLDYAISAIPKLINFLDPEAPQNLTLSNALQTIENQSRFPVLPYYIWNVLEPFPKAFCVSPIWVSNKYFDEQRENTKSRALGLAISGVKPIAELDKSYNSNCQNDIGGPISVEPQILISLLRLMAKPLVESQLYAPAIKHAEDDVKKYFEDKVSTEINS